MQRIAVRRLVAPFLLWAGLGVSLVSCGMPPQEASVEVDVVATRLFAGPGQYPPQEFKAYGILAFPARATPATRSRHLFICEAYLARLPHVSEVRAPTRLQMVTVWPMADDQAAQTLNDDPLASNCPAAVDGYGLVAAQEAIRHARAVGHDLTGRGPFLLAWSPAQDKGKPAAAVLVADMSDVSTAGGAAEILARWAGDIEKKPELWENGWSLEGLRLAIQSWADHYGSRLLALKSGG